MSGQIVPGSRNGLTTQGYPGLGPILNSDSNLLNRNSQGSLNQQSQINLNVSFRTVHFYPRPEIGKLPRHHFPRGSLPNSAQDRLIST